MKKLQPSGNAVSEEDEAYWTAVDIILDRYKDVEKRGIAKLAEKATEEEMPSNLSKKEKRRLLSKRITVAVRAANLGRSHLKQLQPVGHDKLVTVGAKRQDHRRYADTFNNTTEADPDSEYGDLTDTQLSKRHLRQNERMVHEQDQARARIDHIERGVSPGCRKALRELRSRGGPANGEATNSIAEAIGIDHKTLERFFDEARRADRWIIFGTPRPPLKSEEVIRRGPLPVTMETIRKTSGESALPVFEDKRTSVGRSLPRPPRARKAVLSPVEKLQKNARGLSKRWDEHFRTHSPAARAHECEVCKQYVGKLRLLNEKIKTAGAQRNVSLQIPATFKSSNFIWLGPKTRLGNLAFGQ